MTGGAVNAVAVAVVLATAFPEKAGGRKTRMRTAAWKSPWRAAVSVARIRRLADQIAGKFHPRRIILFGSHARGEATPDSDVDLMVVVDRGSSHDLELNIRRQVKCDFALDLLVVDVRRLQTHLAEGDLFLEEVVEIGKVLYEKRDD
jgi:predicted nucleotidyltransferase